MIPIFCRLRAANSARLSHGSRRLQICRSPSIFVERQKYHRRVLTVGHKCGILILALIRRGGGMVDTGDLKSPGSNTVPVRVRSPAPSGTIKYRGVEQLVARRAHNPEVGGSSPPSATNKTTVFVLKTVVFLTFLVNPLGGLGQFKSFQKRKHMLRKIKWPQGCIYFVRIFTAARAADAASGV